MIAEIGHAVFSKLRQRFGADFRSDQRDGSRRRTGDRACTATTARCRPPPGGIGLPECFLGLVPGWGGAYLLPNLIGADRAVTVIIENALNQNRMLSGPQVAELGIADAMFDGADFLERSLDWVAQVVTGAVEVDRPDGRPRRGLGCGRGAAGGSRRSARSGTLRRRRTGRSS